VRPAAGIEKGPASPVLFPFLASLGKSPGHPSFLQGDVAHGPAFVFVIVNLDVEEVAGLAGGNLAHLMGDVVLQVPLFSRIHGLTDIFVLFMSHIGPPFLFVLL
jgi:hypothetical protein